MPGQVRRDSTQLVSFSILAEIKSRRPSERQSVASREHRVDAAVQLWGRCHGFFLPLSAHEGLSSQATDVSESTFA